MPDDYEVGYGRPPESGRFRKGQSGNPAGRRAEQERFASVLREELANDTGLPNQSLDALRQELDAHEDAIGGFDALADLYLDAGGRLQCLSEPYTG
ncbi:hypothetical protein FIU86_08430 [Roseovarius sp. THAF9]|uniref:DUF5681 domain-containing protein n=1 Tax=Roseovarius sp. THAF9 TaxID=2587847 RepID=UPI0012A7F17E|nr:DUF5681 domain-containing protein [Roseovarius sp. THAF9]QFT92868.1 hypothetical protein FIU86_08430 [Roseovarius sp. THAF9]